MNKGTWCKTAGVSILKSTLRVKLFSKNKRGRKAVILTSMVPSVSDLMFVRNSRNLTAKNNFVETMLTTAGLLSCRWHYSPNSVVRANDLWKRAKRRGVSASAHRSSISAKGGSNTSVDGRQPPENWSRNGCGAFQRENSAWRHGVTVVRSICRRKLDIRVLLEARWKRCEHRRFFERICLGSELLAICKSCKLELYCYNSCTWYEITKINLI